MKVSVWGWVAILLVTLVVAGYIFRDWISKGIAALTGGAAQGGNTSTGGAQLPSTNQLPDQPGGLPPSQIFDPNKELKNTFVGGQTGIYMPEVKRLQQHMNDWLPKLNAVLKTSNYDGNLKADTIYRANEVRQRRNSANLQAGFYSNDGDILQLKVDGVFGQKTEDVLYILTGKKTSSLNNIYLTFPPMQRDQAGIPTQQLHKI